MRNDQKNVAVRHSNMETQRTRDQWIGQQVTTEVVKNPDLGPKEQTRKTLPSSNVSSSTQKEETKGLQA